MALWPPLSSETKSPPGLPLFRGCTVRVTLSPGCRVFGFHPSFLRIVTEPISIGYYVCLPLRMTITLIQVCGLVHRNSFTVPSLVIILLVSHIDRQCSADV